MNNYTESKKKLDAIRREYGCKGDVIFKTAIQYVIDYGKHTLLDGDWYENIMLSIDARHNEAEKEGKFLFCTRDFEKAIIDCSVALCDVGTYDLLTYIQREVWLGGGPVGEPDYQRAIGLLKRCMESIDEHHEECCAVLEDFECIGFHDDEIAYFGYEYLFDVEEED